MPETRGASTPPPLPPHARVPLLTLITQQSMDEDYLHAAERRVLRGGPAPTRWGHRTAGAVLAVFGLLVGTAAVQTSRNAGVEDASRSTLVRRITSERADVARLQDRILSLRSRVAELETRSTELATSQQSTSNELRRLQIRTGAVAVEGPGVRIVVDDPVGGEERIRKTDIFLLVNALWQAGAEAVAIDGERLGVLTSINNSNVALNVDDRALLPPYTLVAIGDPRTLAAQVVETSTFARFDQLRSQYGFRFTPPQNDDSIALPAVRSRRLRYAVTLDGDRPDQQDQRKEGDRR